MRCAYVVAVGYVFKKKKSFTEDRANDFRSTVLIFPNLFFPNRASYWSVSKYEQFPNYTVVAEGATGEWLY